ncbi:hypothetical protein [Deinococcus sp. QL22]|uniref:hypothetical protein n=1 Tax=Deinococcus sp. QL22 TaxID=2939437 RepID=UPI0020181852|nr:hypothetical protein [Deinococcus sp. QL22]
MRQSQGEVGINGFKIELNSKVPGAVWQTGKQGPIRGTSLPSPLLCGHFTEQLPDQRHGHDFAVTAFLIGLLWQDKQAAARSGLHIIIDVHVNEREQVFNAMLSQRKFVGSHTRASAFSCLAAYPLALEVKKQSLVTPGFVPHLRNPGEQMLLRPLLEVEFLQMKVPEILVENGIRATTAETILV